MTAADTQFDVVVVGSGAGGLSTAVVAASGGARVLVIEASDLIGGTTATSGGGVWIPCSPVAAAMGHADSAGGAFDYLRALSDSVVTDQRIHAYVDSAREMLAWMAEHTPLAFEAVPYPDYHPELPGASKAGWRTHFPVGFDGRRLGPDVDLIRKPSPVASFLGKINWTLAETHALLHRPHGWLLAFARMLWRYYGDVGQRLRSDRDRFLSCGNAITGCLLFAAKEYGVTVWRNTSLSGLAREGNRITGIVARRDNADVHIAARQAVVLAAGGFERNGAMREHWLPAAAADPGMSGSQRHNLGDAIRIAAEAGAATVNMDSAWWAPVFKVPGEVRGRLCAVERALPGCIMVNQAGRRFLNEAASYHVTAQQMMAADRPEARTAPCWIIFDSRFRRYYPMGPLLPLPLWLHPRPIRSIVIRAGSIDELAAKTELPPDALAHTLKHFNEGARIGRDPEFGRGDSEYDRYYGDPKVQPNPTLAPIERPPFFAMQLHLGDIGTNGGLATDEHARVLDGDGAPIAGLYAAGNTTASVMGHSYPAAGATLGPALTFGYRAALHILGSAALSGNGPEPAGA